MRRLVLKKIVLFFVLTAVLGCRTKEREPSDQMETRPTQAESGVGRGLDLGRFWDLVEKAKQGRAGGEAQI